MKILVIGTSLSGKTTLIRYLRKNNNWPISEIDEELTNANGGKYPTHEMKVGLIPKIIEDVLNKKEIIFFTNTDYFYEPELGIAKNNGFKIVQLDLSLDRVTERNKKRMVEESYPDMSQWLEGMVAYQIKIYKTGLVDKVIDAELPTEKIVEELMTMLD